MTFFSLSLFSHTLDMFTGPPPAGFVPGPPGHHSHQNGTGNGANSSSSSSSLMTASSSSQLLSSSLANIDRSSNTGSNCISNAPLSSSGASSSISPRRDTSGHNLPVSRRSDRRESTGTSIAPVSTGPNGGSLSPINFSTAPFVAGNSSSNLAAAVAAAAAAAAAINGTGNNMTHLTSSNGTIVTPPAPGHSSNLAASSGINHSGHNVLQSTNCQSGATSSHSTPSPTHKESNNHFTPNSLSLALSMAQHQVNVDRNRERMRAWMEGQQQQQQQTQSSHCINDNNSSYSGINCAASRDGLITNEYGQPASPVSLTPVLLDSQIQRLADAAESLIKALPPSLDVKLTSNKKRISKELEVRSTSLSLYFMCICVYVCPSSSPQLNWCAHVFNENVGETRCIYLESQLKDVNILSALTAAAYMHNIKCQTSFHASNVHPAVEE